MKRWPWLHTALTVAACLTPAAAQGQGTATPGEGRTGVLTLYSVSQDAPAGAFPEPAPYYALRERTYRKVLGDALGDQLDYYSELLDRYHFPGASYESDIEDFLVRKYADRMIKVLIANGPVEADLAGAGTGAARVSAANRVPRPRRAAAGSTNRPAIRIGGPFKESLDLALRVHPDTRHVFVLRGASLRDGGTKRNFALRCPCRRGVEFTFLSGYSLRWS